MASFSAFIRKSPTARLRAFLEARGIHAPDDFDWTSEGRGTALVRSVEALLEGFPERGRAPVQHRAHDTLRPLVFGRVEERQDRHAPSDHSRRSTRLAQAQRNPGGRVRLDMPKQARLSGIKRFRCHTIEEAAEVWRLSTHHPQLGIVRLACHGRHAAHPDPRRRPVRPHQIATRQAGGQNPDRHVVLRVLSPRATGSGRFGRLQRDRRAGEADGPVPGLRNGPVQAGD